RTEGVGRVPPWGGAKMLILARNAGSTELGVAFPVVSRHVSMDPVGARRGVLPPGACEEGHPHPAASPRQARTRCLRGVLQVRGHFHRRGEFVAALLGLRAARLADPSAMRGSIRFLDRSGAASRLEGALRLRGGGSGPTAAAPSSKPARFKILPRGAGSGSARVSKTPAASGQVPPNNRPQSVPWRGLRVRGTATLPANPVGVRSGS